MTVQQVLDILQEEKQNAVSSRFPCRAIMVKNIQQYVDLISRLHAISDIREVSTAELFASADVLPKYENLTEPKYKDKWLILTGVSEYLKLFGKGEAANPRFAKLWNHQVDAQSKGRIIIPLWDCESQWHDPALNLCGDIRQDDFMFDCIDENAHESSLNVLVLSGEFEQYVMSLSQNGHICFGLQEWFDYWQSPDVNQTELILLTRRYNKIQSTIGNISVRVIADTMAFVQENLKNGKLLSKENCGSEALTLLFDYALKGEHVDAAILSALNTVAFSGVGLMGQWSGMSEGKRQLMELWYKLHPDNTYLCHCFQASTVDKKLCDHILHDIFNLRATHPEWCSEQQNLISAIGIEKDTAYFAELDQIPDFSERLTFLTGKSKDERIYLLRMVGMWMRQDISQVLACEEIKTRYPELFAYLDDNEYPLSEELRRYFTRYKSYKLENTLPPDEETYFAGVNVDSLEMRYSQLSEAIGEDTIVLWIDALGAEWLPLLKWSLTQQCSEAKIKDVHVVQATLPTETCFNDQWNQMNVPHKKLDKLDKLAHKGIIDDPDYYACIEDQLSFVASIASEVNSLLTTYHRVIITGDHGTSRLAARFFHNREGIPVPKTVKVYSHGRYCEVQDPTPVLSSSLVSFKENGEIRYQAFSNYDHFIQSGFAAGAEDDRAIYGEVHGGATPEEVLVPVVVVESLKEIPLSAQWEKQTVKISMKKAKGVLCFNKPVRTLEAKIDAFEAVCSCNPDCTKWTLIFSGIKSDTYSVVVVADGKIVSVPKLTINSALGDGIGDI